MAKVDPIRDRYFGPLTVAEFWSEILFYAGAVLSLVVFFVEETAYPIAHSILHSALICGVLALWALNLAIRLYFAPRAHDRRFEDFLSNAYGVPLSGHDKTEGYYNTDANGAIRVGAQLLENSLHSKDTAVCMARLERVKAAVFIVLLIVTALNRTTQLSFLAIAAQAVFSEQLVSRWFRIEWLRQRFEGIHAELYRLFQAKPESSRFEVLVWLLVAKYEAAKTNAAVTLSERIFNARNAVVSQEWLRIKGELKL